MDLMAQVLVSSCGRHVIAQPGHRHHYNQRKKPVRPRVDCILYDPDFCLEKTTGVPDYRGPVSCKIGRNTSGKFNLNLGSNNSLVLTTKRPSVTFILTIVSCHQEQHKASNQHSSVQRRVEGEKYHVPMQDAGKRGTRSRVTGAWFPYS